MRGTFRIDPTGPTGNLKQFDMFANKPSVPQGTPVPGLRVSTWAADRLDEADVGGQRHAEKQNSLRFE